MILKAKIEQFAGDLVDVPDNVIERSLATAVNNAYSALPDSLLIESTHTPIDLISGTTNVDITNKTIIYVTRTNDSTKRKLCLEVNPLHWDKYSDTGSIYCATKDNPVYSVTNNSGIPTLEVAPIVTGTDSASANVAKVYWRPTYETIPVDPETEIPNFPKSGERFVILNASLLVLSYKLNQSNLEEEDMELTQLIQSSLASVKGQQDMELSRLKREESTPFDDQAIQQMEDPTKGKSTKR